MHKQKTNSGGTLLVVSTPIGNLEDMSQRAITVLQTVDLVLAEDTRSFGRLAKRFNVGTRTASYHEHNEAQRTAEALELLRGGSKVALVSEAGTPTVSDPGYRIVRACRESGINVVPVPGPSAAVAALSVSGFETDRFTFFGFLPIKAGKREAAVREALASNCCVVLYVSPHKIVKTLGLIAKLEADRELFLAREMTKMHEEYLSGTAAELAADFAERSSIKGEIVLIVRGARHRR